MPHNTLSAADQDFTTLGLKEELLSSVAKMGYTEPTPIQQQMIPHMLAGEDVIGQAQTGTGKTAAFALPLLHKLNLSFQKSPQVLVLAPTRELALQVCESFDECGSRLRKLKTAAVFGGQDYSTQLRKLRRGVHVVVGTPGRVMDHIRRGNLNLEYISSVVLDEADEMLNMGFLDDVEWILSQTPERRQVALFSATMPATIRKIANKYLQNPVEIKIGANKNNTVDIEQQYVIAPNRVAKNKALQVILETEDIDAGLVFVRTKVQTLELAEFIAGLGCSCGAINGDIPQEQRLRMVEQLKNGKVKILVATDVAARGLDVDRISHVINYDPAFDAESYVHRIGRTGRAGRSGKAYLFLPPREKRKLGLLEKKTSGKIKEFKMPSAGQIRAVRIDRFKDKISMALGKNSSDYETIITDYCQEHQVSPERVAAALARLVGGDTLIEKHTETRHPRNKKQVETTNVKQGNPRKKDQGVKKMAVKLGSPEPGMERFRIEIGDDDGVKPGNIVGAIANEADISSEFIGKIAIFSEYSTVDLPYGMPQHVLRILQRARIHDKTMRMKREDGPDTIQTKKSRKGKKGKKKKMARKSGRKPAAQQ